MKTFIAFMREDFVPTNSVGPGDIAGLTPDSLPAGLTASQRRLRNKRPANPIVLPMGRRKLPIFTIPMMVHTIKR